MLSFPTRTLELWLLRDPESNRSLHYKTNQHHWNIMNLLSTQQASISKFKSILSGSGGSCSRLTTASINGEDTMSFSAFDNKVMGQYMAPDIGRRIVIVIIDADHKTPPWHQYVDGLISAYERHGIPVSRDEMLKEREDSRCLMALALNDEGSFEGGVRVEGPFMTATEMPGLKALDDSSENYDDVVQRYQQFFHHNNVVCEGKGQWASVHGLGSALATVKGYSLLGGFLRFPHLEAVLPKRLRQPLTLFRTSTLPLSR